MKKPFFLLMLCMILFFCLNSVCYSQYVTKKISRNPYYDDTNPQINNNGYVVWQGYDGTDWEIFLYDGTTTTQLTNNSYDDENPQINDNGYVVWQGYDGTDYEIYLYNGTETIQLTDNSYDDIYPQINNNGHVVWQGYDGTDFEIFLYDGSNTLQLTNDSYNDIHPQINNNGSVVWIGRRDEIFLYDGISITQISDDFRGGDGPRINDKGDVVWYRGHAYEEGGIYLYNGTDVFWLTKNPGYENRDPDLNNNGQVVWIREPIEGGPSVVMLFDGTKKVQLTNPDCGYQDPKINNKGEIAWTRGCGTGIIVYNGVTFTELSSGTAFGPQINDSGFVVFEKFSGSNSDIYLASRVSVISPDGGEIVPSGLPFMIRWVGPSGVVKYKVRYSMDNGLTWNKAHQEPYVTGTALDCNVPVPPANRRKCLVGVIGFNASDTAVSRDRSDKPFTIEVLRLTSPNAGEPPLTSGGQHTITWTTNATMAPVDHIVLSYTLNNGLTWKKIDTIADSFDDGSFIWNVPNVTKQKNNCKVKTVLKDASGNTVGSDVSDGVFTIQPAPLP